MEPAQSRAAVQHAETDLSGAGPGGWAGRTKRSAVERCRISPLKCPCPAISASRFFVVEPEGVETAQIDPEVTRLTKGIVCLRSCGVSFDG